MIANIYVYKFLCYLGVFPVNLAKESIMIAGIVCKRKAKTMNWYLLGANIIITGHIWKNRLIHYLFKWCDGNNYKYTSIDFIRNMIDLPILKMAYQVQIVCLLTKILPTSPDSCSMIQNCKWVVRTFYVLNCQIY